MLPSDGDAPPSPQPIRQGSGDVVVAGMLVAKYLERPGPHDAGLDQAASATHAAVTGDGAEAAAAPVAAEPARKGKSGPFAFLHNFVRRVEIKIRSVIEKRISKGVERARVVVEMQSELRSLVADREHDAQRTGATLGRLLELNIQLSERLERLERRVAGIASAPSAAGEHGRQALQPSLIPLGGDLLAVRSLHGYVAVPRTKPALLGCLADGVIPCAGALDVVERLLGPGDSFLDMAAGDGVLALAAARRVGPNGTVLAVERDATAVDALRMTVALNRLADLMAIWEPAAALPEPCAGPGKGVGARAKASPKADRPAPLPSADSVTQPGSRWSLVKIVVQESGSAALAGMRRILEDNPSLPILAAFGAPRVAGDVEGWLQEVADRGYTAYEIHDQQPMLRPLRVPRRGERASCHLLLVQQRRGAVAALLKAAGL